MIVVKVTMVMHGQNVTICTTYICVVYCKLISCSKAGKNKRNRAYIGLSPRVRQRTLPAATNPSLATIMLYNKSFQNSVL